jgi:hypothetical protein
MIAGKELFDQWSCIDEAEPTHLNLLANKI